MLNLFASSWNHQLPYYSWLLDLEALAVDAFTQNWPQMGVMHFHHLP